MNRSIVAIPLLAAIWFAAPARASAQDPQPEPRVAQPRTAVPRPERPVRGTEPRVVKAPVAAAAPTPTAAEADDQRGRVVAAVAPGATTAAITAAITAATR